MAKELVALEVEHSEHGSLVGIASEWRRWSSNCPLYEIRQPRTDICQEDLLSDWARSGVQAVVARDEAALREALTQSCGIVAPRDLVRRALPYLDGPRSCASLTSAGLPGFADIDALPRALLRRSPSERVRRFVTFRDRFRCRECGEVPIRQGARRPSLHHWLPWRDGGLTHPHNLVLVCKPCHEKLERAERDFSAARGSPTVTRPPLMERPTWFTSNRVVVRMKDTLPFELREAMTPASQAVVRSGSMLGHLLLRKDALGGCWDMRRLRC